MSDRDNFQGLSFPGFQRGWLRKDVQLTSSIKHVLVLHPPEWITAPLPLEVVHPLQTKSSVRGWAKETVPSRKTGGERAGWIWRGLEGRGHLREQGFLAKLLLLRHACLLLPSLNRLLIIFLPRRCSRTAVYVWREPNVS